MNRFPHGGAEEAEHSAVLVVVVAVEFGRYGPNEADQPELWTRRGISESLILQKSYECEN